MRMPFTEFLSNGDLKFVLLLYAFLIAAIIYFVKKTANKEHQKIYNLKINKLVNWSLYITVFSLLLGLMHSFYFISKAKGIANHLLFGGLSNVIITPVLGIAVAMIIKLLATPLKED
jgi:cytochrome bd-type quinol oxidase subunit 2